MIDLDKLPSSDFVNTEEITSASGVYFVICTGNKILYIGQSKNIQKRIKTHGLKPVFKDRNVARIAWIECDESIRLEKESQMILMFRPELNIARKPYVRRDALRQFSENIDIPGIGDAWQDSFATAIAMDLELF